MMAFMAANPEAFKELVLLAFFPKNPLAPRAAWLLSNCMEEKDPRVGMHAQNIIDTLDEVADGHKRDLINVLCQVDLDEELEGVLFDRCINIWCKLDGIPSVRATAFKLILLVTRKYPDLYNEVVLLTQDPYLETLSPGIRRSIQKQIKSFEKSLDHQPRR